MYRSTIPGKVESAYCRQPGHCRSAYSMSVTFALGSPRIAPSCGMSVKSIVGVSTGAPPLSSEPARKTTATRTSATATAIAPPNASTTASRDGRSGLLESAFATGSINTPADTPPDEWSVLGALTSLAAMIDLATERKATAITQRQREVIALIAAGCSNDEVGARLGISPRTAKAHCDVLRQKLGVTRRRQIPIAFRLLTGEDPLSVGQAWSLAPRRQR